MNALLRNLRYAFRMLLKQRAFTTIAVLTLALGIGANTAIFSVVEAVLLRPLPFYQPGRLVMLWETETSPGNYPLTGPDFLDWQKQNHAFSGMTLTLWPYSDNLSAQGSAAHVTGVPVEANFFHLLGSRPLLGRTFAPGEDQAGKNRVAVLSYGFWQKNFAGNRAIVGKSIELNGETYSVIGVMPRSFRLLSGVDLWTPMDMSPAKLGPRGEHQYRAIGRLKPGVAVAQAQADLQIIAARLQKKYPDSNEGENAIVVSMREQLTGKTRPALLLLLGAVGLVLLIACVNVANLLLARASGRQREMAVRAALGAGRGRLVGQLLTESLLLSLLGGAVGILFAQFGLAGLKALDAQRLLPTSGFGINSVVLLFTLGIALVSAVLFGLAPALQLSRADQFEELKGATRTTHATGWGRRGLRDALVVGEVALSLLLLVGAGLLLRSFARMQAVDVGVNPRNVLTMSLSLPDATYSTPQQKLSFIHALQHRLEALPGVTAAAISTELPLEGGSNGYITIPGRPEKQTEGTLVEWGLVTPGYFKALRIPLYQGRLLDAADGPVTAKLAAETPKPGQLTSGEVPVVINQVMAKTFWPGQSPLGQEFDNSGLRARVVGVAGNVREFSLRKQAIPEAWLLPELFPSGFFHIVLCSRVAPAALAGEVRHVVAGMDNSLPVFQVRTMNQVIAQSLTQSRFQTSLLTLFALLALVLAAVGLYGVLSYQVTQQTREIGIRMALGADRSAVVRMVVGHGVKLVLVGVVLGGAGAWALGRLLKSFLFGVTATDGVTLTAVPLVLLAVSVLACLLPAWRASRVNPTVALRYE